MVCSNKLGATEGQRVIALRKSTEQSENVYENKGLDEKSLAGAEIVPKRLRYAEGAVR